MKSFPIRRMLFKIKRTSNFLLNARGDAIYPIYSYGLFTVREVSQGVFCLLVVLHLETHWEKSSSIREVQVPSRICVRRGCSLPFSAICSTLFSHFSRFSSVFSAFSTVKMLSDLLLVIPTNIRIAPGIEPIFSHRASDLDSSYSNETASSLSLDFSRDKNFTIERTVSPSANISYDQRKFNKRLYYSKYTRKP